MNNKDTTINNKAAESIPVETVYTAGIENPSVAAIYIGTDRLLFSPNSAVRKRIAGYAEQYAHLYDIVFSLKKHNLPEADTISSKCTAYATRTHTKVGYIVRALRIGMKVVNKVADDTKISLIYISTQDPFETGIVGMLLTWYAKYICGSKVVWNTDIHTDLYSPYFARHAMQNRVRLLIASYTIPRAHSVRVVSNRIKQALTLRGVPEEKIIVRPIEVAAASSVGQGTSSLSAEYTAQVEVLKENYWPIVFMAGRLMPEKDYGLAFSIFTKYVAETVGRHGAGGRDFRAEGDANKLFRPLLCIAGDGLLYKTLNQKAQKINTDNKAARIQLLGSLSSDAMKYWYTNADIFLHTSEFEGYGMVLKEAYMAGLPIVTTDVGIAPDLQKERPDSVLIFEVKDVSGGVKALKEMTERLDRGYVAAQEMK